MANVKLIFGGSKHSEGSELECFYNTENEIFVEITSEDGMSNFITLDKSTAIKLAKTLRTEINKIDEQT